MIRVLLTLAMLWSSSLSFACDRTFPIQLVRVIDGDTIEAVINLGFDIGMVKSIRIAGFDAPETFRPNSQAERLHGLDAKAEAEKLLVGKLTLKSCGYGAYNRVEGLITLEDGRDFTQIMIDKGFEKRDNYSTYSF